MQTFAFVGGARVTEHKDERLEAATSHWAMRFVANGTDYPDFVATVSRVARWEDWCGEWGRTAERYERLAEQAEQAGRHSTAAEAWRRAALCWHWGKFVFAEYPDQQRAASERAVDDYAKGAHGLNPPAQRVEIPYPGRSLPGYLRVPDGAGRPPVVIMAPGLDSVKEELQATANYMTARGLATLAIDGPGQGESEYDLPIEPAYEKVASAVVDFLQTRDDVDPARIGLFGVSLGGYYAARAAAHEPRLVACVDLAGPYRFDRDWDSLPSLTRTTFQRRSGADSPEEARSRAGQLSLENSAAEISKPLLIVHGALDRLVPPWHAQHLADQAPGAQLLMYDDGNHGLTNYAFETRSYMADWLADKLG